MWKPEVIKGAQEMWNVLAAKGDQWDDPAPHGFELFEKEQRDDFVRAFASGLAAITVSDELIDKLEAQPHFDCTPFSDLFIAALRYLTGPDAGDAKGQG